MLTVVVHLKDQSQPIIYYDVMNTYEKGSFYCVYVKKCDKDLSEQEFSYKHPIADIWRIKEDYGHHGRPNE